MLTNKNMVEMKNEAAATTAGTGRRIHRHQDEDDDDDYSCDGDEEEALSLSELPVEKDQGDGLMISQDMGDGHGADEFQFFGSWAGEMCAAEDVFYQGRILPLRPSVSSDPGLRSRGRFDSSRSSSINSSSSSSGRRSDSVLLHPLYAHPSPKPQMGRRSFGGAQGASGGRKNGGWGLLRLGLVQPPPSVIELQDLKQRSFRKNQLFSNGVDAINQTSPSTNPDSNDTKNAAKKEEDSRGSWLSKFSCKCSASTALDIVLPTVIMNKRRGSASPPHELLAEEEEEGEAVALVGGRRRRRVADRRTYEWLQKLSIQGGGGPQA